MVQNLNLATVSVMARHTAKYKRVLFFQILTKYMTEYCAWQFIVHFISLFDTDFAY